jgi:glycosyltransferase involved in cell wall biosynthesis
VSRRRVLVVAPFPPRIAATQGGARVIGRLAFELALTNDLGVLSFRARDDAEVDDALRERLAFLEHVPLPEHRTFRRRLHRAGEIALGWASGEPRFVTNYGSTVLDRRLQTLVAEWRPDIVQLEFHVLAQYRTPPGPARVVVVHEPGSESAAALGGLTARIDARAWERYERRVLPSADAVVVFTDEDRVAVERHGARRVARIPFGADQLELPAVPPGPPTVLYLGNFSHAPNLDAAERLVNAILPRVRRTVPAARLALVGPPPPRAQLPSGPGVDQFGFVADISSLLAAATVVAAPLCTGGGMRVKVAESLGAGKALVASRRAMAGIGATPGRHYAPAETDDEFAAAISRLLLDDAERSGLESAARDFALTSLRWEDAARAYVALYQQLRPAASVPEASATLVPGAPGPAAPPPRDE